MVDSQHATLSVRRQCELLGGNRASFYFQAASESALNLDLMRLIDEQFLRTPFYGWPKMTAAAAAPSTTSSANAYGAASSTKTSISTSITW